MPSSLLETELPERVKSALREALPGASITCVEVAENYLPLLLLQVNQILAAFAFGTDDESYGKLYNGFKKHFSTSGDQWKSLDVSFVYCLPNGSHPTDAFCSQVEADVYFCRKFIVALSEDIASSLLRLPFLPLAPLAGSPLRPPSAQTLLQRSNVSAELARFLVIQNARSAQSILADCLANRFGNAEPLIDAQMGHDSRRDHIFNPVSLESLTIENFRAYRKSKTFTFGSAITVLYGPNGFGKTSFFDALDFVVTGGIGRLPSGPNDQALSKAARHLDSNDEPSTVTLTFRRGEDTHTVVRDLSDPKQAKVDFKKSATRKEVLTMLTGGEGAGADRVENFVSLFRATHLFSQERQELTQDFQAKSELSSDIVSRMLAFEDYVSGIKKTNDVQALIKSAMDRAGKEITRLEAIADKDRAELSRLEGLAAATANPSRVEEELTLLKEDLIEIGIEIEDVNTEASIIRGWRAQIESSIAELNGLSEKLSNAVGDLQRLNTIVSELGAIESRLSQQEALLATKELNRIQAEESLQSANVKLAQVRSLETSIQRTRDSLSWIAATRAEYYSLVRERDELSTKIQLATQEDVRLRHEGELTISARSSAERTLSELTQQIAASSERLQSLRSLGSQQPLVAAAAARLRDVGNAEQECIDSINNARKLLGSEKETLASIQVKVASLESEVAAREAEGAEVKSLLAQLRSHVTDGTCLLCGVDHGSRQALLTQIDARLNQEGRIVEVQTWLADQRAEAMKIAKQVAALQQRLQDELARQVSLRADKVEADQVIANFSRDIAVLGIALAEPEWSKERLDALIREAEVVLSNLIEKRDAAAQAKDAAVRASEAARAEVGRNASARQDAVTALESVDKAIARLVGDPRRIGAGFDSAPEAIQSEIERNTEDLKVANTSVSEGQALIDGCNADLAQKLQEVTSVKKALADDQRRKGLLISSISDLNASLSHLGLTSESSEDSVTSLISENSQNLAHLSALRDRTANLEVALDAATTAAALESLRVSLREHESSIDSIRRDRASHEPWAKYFDAVARLLGDQQNLATEDFTRQYGPRTAVIQRRLRPVYGFGDIEVSSKGGAISVRVARNGEALRPIDYFSQSQIQTLVLGLFLTACSSQTWSAFSSLMMDDPVTHFDDLNTYALLDLIAGLLQSPDGGRQFVISTCDEKLLQLARQKFRHLKDGAKFYRFSAIGAEGPLVSEIPA